MDSKLNLRSLFEVPTLEEWKELVQDSLKGGDFDKIMHTKTYEGIVLKPIYTKEDVEGLGFAKSMPGAAPFVRGNDPEGFLAEGWLVAQKQTEKDLKKLNAILIEELNRGLNMINLGRLSPTGIKLTSAKDFAKALEGIELKAAPLFAQIDADNEDVFAYLEEYLHLTGQSPRELKGCLGFDPIGDLALKGYTELSWEERMEKLYDAVILRADRAPQFRAIIIDGTVYEAAGASSVQELAFALATAGYYIKALLATGMQIDTIAPLFAVKLSLGSNFFMEIAKVRAFRLLFSEMIKAFGGNEELAKIWIHGKTASFNKSTYDLYVNMLRTSTESFSAVIGGVDSLEVQPFDNLVKEDNAFARRIARNQQLILKEEAHFDKVLDPAGGCYYIESLTAQLAELSWKLMQELEAKGGIFIALKEGYIHQLIEEVAKARKDSVHKRRDVFVGVNMYANPSDEYLPLLKQGEYKPKDIALSLEKGALPRRRVVEDVEALRAKLVKKAPKIMLLNMGTVAEYKARADFSLGFFQMAGFEVDGTMAFASVEEAVQAAKDSDADAFCICSTDGNYEELVAPLCAGLSPKMMILAGYPLDKIEEYKAAGIDHFIHIRANAYETLKAIADELEVN